MEIHDQILELLAEDLATSKSKFTSKHHFIFENYRSSRGESTGFRLTGQGRRLLSKYNEEFTYTHKLKEITGAMLLKLERKMSWPYYIDKEVITFFSPEDSAWYRLYDENLNNFLSDM